MRRAFFSPIEVRFRVFLLVLSIYCDLFFNIERKFDLARVVTAALQLLQQDDDSGIIFTLLE